MKVELVTYTQNPEETIEKAARICYDSKLGDLEKRKKFLTGLVKSGHLSTIEHASATFKISEISRACSHEIVRSRLASFSQRSQRYCNEDEFNVVYPKTIAESKPYYDVDGNAISFQDKWKVTLALIENFYNEMVKAGIPKEDARYILPNACCTELYMSANFREWRHFLELRLSPRAQWEIRELAHMILEKLYEIAPIVFQDLKEKFSCEK